MPTSSHGLSMGWDAEGDAGLIAGRVGAAAIYVASAPCQAQQPRVARAERGWREEGE